MGCLREEFCLVGDGLDGDGREIGLGWEELLVRGD